MSDFVIYKTTNIINNKIYVGKSIKNSSSYLGSGLLLNRAIKKYGRENFIKEIIDTAENKTELNEKEKFWIAQYEDKYNISDGGDGGDTWTNNPNYETMCKKITEINKKRWKNTSIKERKEFGRKISKANLGKTKVQPPRTAEHNMNNRLANKGISRNKGIDNPMYGKTKENNEKKRLSELKHSKTAKKLGFWVGDKNPSHKRGGK